MKSLAIVVGISLLMTIGVYIFPSVIILFPIAFIVIGVKYDTFNSFISILITSFLIGISIDMISGLIMLAVFGPMALYIGDGISKRKKSRDIIVPSSIIFFLSTILVFMMLRGFSGISLIGQLEENIKMVTDMQLSMMDDMELTNIESFRVKEEADNMYNNMLTILPSIFIVLSVIISYINYYLATIVLRKLGLGIRDNPRFSRFSLPNNFIIGTVVMFLIVYLLGNFEAVSGDMIQFNLTVLVSSLLFIQGLSVLDFLLLRFRLNIVFRIIIIGIALFAPSITRLLAIVGIADIIFDFRKLRRRKL